MIAIQFEDNFKKFCQCNTLTCEVNDCILRKYTNDKFLCARIHERMKNRLQLTILYILHISYTYLYLTHTCISEFLEKGEISDESISKLLEELDKQNNQN